MILFTLWLTSWSCSPREDQLGLFGTGNGGANLYGVASAAPRPTSHTPSRKLVPLCAIAEAHIHNDGCCEADIALCSTSVPSAFPGDPSSSTPFGLHMNNMRPVHWNRSTNRLCDFGAEQEDKQKEAAQGEQEIRHWTRYKGGAQAIYCPIHRDGVLLLNLVSTLPKNVADLGVVHAGFETPVFLQPQTQNSSERLTMRSMRSLALTSAPRRMAWFSSVTHDVI